MVGEIPVLWVEPTAAPPNERRQLIIWLPCARKSQHRTALHHTHADAVPSPVRD